MCAKVQGEGASRVQDRERVHEAESSFTWRVGRAEGQSRTGAQAAHEGLHWTSL